MKTTKSTFHHMVEKSSEWVSELADTLDWNDEHRAYGVLRAVLHTLRDRMPLEHVVQFGAQLPSLLRGVYYEGWRPAGKPLKFRHKDDFIAAVSVQMNHPHDLNLEVATTAVFWLFATKMSSGEIANVAHCLPKQIRELMPKEAANV